MTRNTRDFRAPSRRVPGCRSIFVRYAADEEEAYRYAQGERDLRRFKRLMADQVDSYKRARAKVTLAKFSWDK